jgi:hypothetical protein
MDAKKVPCMTAVGKFGGSPFPDEVVARTKEDLRSILNEAGFGRGMPVQGDVPQAFDI